MTSTSRTSWPSRDDDASEMSSSDDGDDASDSGEDFMRGGRRKRSREEAIYGSFLEDMTEVGGRGRGGDDDEPVWTKVGVFPSRPKR